MKSLFIKHLHNLQQVPVPYFNFAILQYRYFCYCGNFYLSNKGRVKNKSVLRCRIGTFLYLGCTVLQQISLFVRTYSIRILLICIIFLDP